MPRWSQEEANRTIDEIKKRSLVDLEFRKLALLNAKTAIAKVNPKPLPASISIKFVAGSDAIDLHTQTEGGVLVVPLPDPVPDAGELSESELEQAAGGLTNIQFPTE
jgi:hypothetical protein